jgi:hypothetical protein
LPSSRSAWRPSTPRLLSKPATLSVRKDDAPSTEAFPKHAILGFQIVDRHRLLPLQPTGNQHAQELQQRCGGSYLGLDVGCLVLLRQPPRRQVGGFKDAVEFRNTTAYPK